jgi:hypothetical protein
MSNIVRLSNRDWVGIVCTTVVVIGGLYKILFNELAITQAVTISQLETIARMQERILSRLEALEQQ